MSSNNRKSMPNTNPTAAGSQVVPQFSALISRLGMSNDHTDAATITPDAKPKSNLRSRSLILPRSKKTMAAPRAVPRKGRVSMRCMLFVFSERFATV